MNNKLPRLVLVGVGSVAVAIFSVFISKNNRNSSKASGASIDASSYEIAGCGGSGEPACPPASAVRG